MMAKRGTTAAIRPGKRQKVSASTNTLAATITDASAMEVGDGVPPARHHDRVYHSPLMLSHESTAQDLLQWYDSTSTTRNMPWRKPFPTTSDLPKDPEAKRDLLSRRAYEVWVSEIMLQQTRVSTVIPYFNNWIEKWPTIQALADANQDDVLAAWKGLGYYSRATRLWKGAKMIIEELGGQVPDTVDGLLKVSGIGPYTAGAVASIAFGRAVPLVDGNVARVLSRQTGLYADMKKKEVDNMIWDIARNLVKGASESSEHTNDQDQDISDIPGRWNQGLMELGSTICTPRPRCGDCPIQETCRVYTEAKALLKPSSVKQPPPDIEDACAVCDPLPSDLVSAAALGLVEAPNEPDKENATKSRPTQKGPKQRSLADFAFSAPKKAASVPSPTDHSNDKITAYCSLFPKRAVKKAVPEEDAAVCIFRVKTSGGLHYLLQQRPDKGLLASMWEFPSFTIPADSDLGEEEVLDGATGLVKGLDRDELAFKGKLGSVTHVFSHLKLNMHVYSIVIELEEIPKTKPRQKWVDLEGVENATVGTGTKRCWEVYKAKTKGL
ncbi:DNA glycosylase [Elsinoe ampelina]|uniref:Adenine DNA glycosylase n=1 Tax=Elsinoe ampelina TaxID=302913 RepID=A0A6A6GGX6_9PEZI|nr:DNA glycosylase [Elsinoe ampelina]